MHTWTRLLIRINNCDMFKLQRDHQLHLPQSFGLSMFAGFSLFRLMRYGTTGKTSAASQATIAVLCPNSKLVRFAQVWNWAPSSAFSLLQINQFPKQRKINPNDPDGPLIAKGPGVALSGVWQLLLGCCIHLLRFVPQIQQFRHFRDCWRATFLSFSPGEYGGTQEKTQHPAKHLAGCW